jgi:hypothetical protein
MANFRGRSQFSYSYAAKRVELSAKISIGASGAPTLVAGTGQGISSITRTSAGHYTVSLSSAYGALLMVRHIINSGSSAPAAPSLYIAADNSASFASPSIQLVTNLAGTATDPASGEIILLQIELNDSALSY